MDEGRTVANFQVGPFAEEEEETEVNIAYLFLDNSVLPGYKLTLLF